MSKRQYKKALFFLVAIITLALVPLVMKNPYLLHLSIMIFFHAIYALSWAFLVRSGQLSLGHAAFLGIGCYTTAILIKLDFPPWFALLSAPFMSMLAGLFIGVICTRLREWFLALATLAFAVMLDPIFGSWDLAGRRGGIAVPSLFPAGEYIFVQEYYLFLGVLILSFTVMYLLLKSRFGAAFSAIRQNELEAELSGINTVKYKLICFIVSAFFAGLAGSFFAQYVGRITPTIFSLDYSLMPALITIVGGTYITWGPILGSVIVLMISEGLKILPYGATVIRLVIIGIVLVIFMIFAPRGLAPLLAKTIKGITLRKVFRKPLER